MGVFHSPKNERYMRNPWNVLDFVIVLISIMDMCVYLGANFGYEVGFLKALRVMRALRPLR